MAIAIVQSKESSVSSGSPSTATVALTGVGAGNCLVGIVKQHEQAARTYTLSDTVIGAWPARIRIETGTNDQVIAAFATYGHTGGDTTVTATINTGDWDFYLSVFELSGIEQLLADDGGKDDVTTDANAYACPTGVTNAAEGIVVCGVCSPYGSTSYTAPTGYAKPTGDSFTSGASAAKYFASGVSAERPAFTQVGTARNVVGVTLYFGATAATATFVPRVIMVL